MQIQEAVIDNLTIPISRQDLILENLSIKAETVTFAYLTDTEGT